MINKIKNPITYATKVMLYAHGYVMLPFESYLLCCFYSMLPKEQAAKAKMIVSGMTCAGKSSMLQGFGLHDSMRFNLEQKIKWEKPLNVKGKKFNLLFLSSHNIFSKNVGVDKDDFAEDIVFVSYYQEAKRSLHTRRFYRFTEESLRDTERLEKVGGDTVFEQLDWIANKYGLDNFNSKEMSNHNFEVSLEIRAAANKKYNRK